VTQGWKTTQTIQNNVTLRPVRITIFAVEKQPVLNILSACIRVLVIRHAKCMRRVILSSVTCLALPHLTAVSYKRRDFLDGVIERKICVFRFSLQLMSETFLIPRRTEREVIISVHKSSRSFFFTF
jgi:hypothetical protein